MPYPESLVAPMRAEMTQMGAAELRTVADVDAAIGGNTGIPRIRIDRNCKRLIWEIEEGYKFEKSRDGTNKPKPKDENNHLTKALAYGLVDEFGFVEAVRARQQPSKHVPLSRLRREYQGGRNATH